MKLSVYAPINLLSYGIVSASLTDALVKLGHEVQLYAINERQIECEPHHFDSVEKSLQNAMYFNDRVPCVKIWHQWQHSLFPACSARIGFPIFELDKLTKLERHNLETLDRVLVCSKWAKSVCEQNIVSRSIEVVPLGVDTSVFTPKANKPKGKTIFLNIGKWEYRKGHRELLEAFNKAFQPSDKVELWMMADNPFLTEEQRKSWENLYKNSPLGSKIKLLPRLQTQNDVKYIIDQVHWGVFPSRAEGWGLGTLEMMACGVPSIVSNYSGFTEFCNSDNALLIEFDGVEIANDGIWFKPGGMVNDGCWGKFTENTMDQLILQMREAHRMNIEQDSKLESLKQKCIETANHFTWENSAKTLVHHLSRWE